MIVNNASDQKNPQYITYKKGVLFIKYLVFTKGLELAYQQNAKGYVELSSLRGINVQQCMYNFSSVIVIDSNWPKIKRKHPIQT